MAGILTGALNRDLLRVWAAVVLVLWLVLLGARFSLYLGEAVGGRLPGDVVAQLAGLKSVGFAAFVMPVAFYIALLLVLEARHRNFEAVALAAGGFGPLDYLRAFAGSVFLITLLNLLLVLFIVPATVETGYRLKAEAVAAQGTRLWTPGRFISLRGGDVLLFAQRAAQDPHTLNDVFVRLDRPAALVSAASAVLETDASGNGVLRLERGYRYEGQAGRADFRRLGFERYSIDLHAPAAGAPLKWDAMPTGLLKTSTEPAAVAEWQARLSRPLSVPVLAVCALLVMARRPPGGAHLGRLALGLAIFAVYFLLLGAIQDFVAAGELAAWPGLWWVHLVPLALSGIVPRPGWRR
jgi:lipopolysaccharide export system permease protein